MSALTIVFVGPLYVGITHAPKGQTGLALSIGRP